LLVVGFPRDGIESVLRHLIYVGFSEMEWHEHLAGRGDLSEPQLNLAHAAAARYDVHRIVAAQSELFRVARIHFEPGPRRKPFENRNLASLGARVPMFHGPASVQY